MNKPKVNHDFHSEVPARSRCRSSAGPDLPADLLLNVCLSLLESINACVLTGDSTAASRGEMAGLAEKLRSDIGPQEAVEVQDSARRILSLYGETHGETAHRTAEEMQQIVGALSQALSLLAGGGERSISRLERIQEMLHRTAAIEDVSDLRASLATTIVAIQEESAREKAVRARDLAALRAEVGKVRGFAAGKPGRRLPGRPEGIRVISQALERVKPEEALYVVAFLFHSVKSIIQRFGPDVADELIFRIVKERVEPVAPENTAFRWTSSSLVGVFQSAPDLPGLKSRMAELNRDPLVHRVELGNRTAVLKLGISHLVAQGAPGAQTQLIAEVDRFTGAEA